MEIQLHAVLLGALLTAPTVSHALENLNEASLEVVSAEGIGHLLPTRQNADTESRSSGSAAHTGTSRSMDLQWNTAGIDNNVRRSDLNEQRIDVSERIRTNDATASKVADIDIRMNSNRDLTNSSGDQDSLRLNLTTQVDSVAAINARHHPDDVVSRGSYYVEQMQINSTVVINSNR